MAWSRLDYGYTTDSMIKSLGEQLDEIQAQLDEIQAENNQQIIALMIAQQMLSEFDKKHNKLDGSAYLTELAYVPAEYWATLHISVISSNIFVWCLFKYGVSRESPDWYDPDWYKIKR